VPLKNFESESLGNPWIELIEKGGEEREERERGREEGR